MKNHSKVARIVSIEATDTNTRSTSTLPPDAKTRAAEWNGIVIKKNEREM